MTERTLDGRTALVTGGSRGIGRACCIRLAQSGANVAVNFRSDEAAAAETVKLVESAGTRGHAVQGDVSSETDVARMVDDVTAALGPIDLLVNNAGIFQLATHAETTPELWRRTLDVNLTGTFLVTSAILPGMIERRFGRIVNIASISGLRPRSRAIAYAASKAGMISLTQGLSEAVAGDNVRVNAVAPGLIDTEILADADAKLLDDIISATPIPRIGRPEEIAEIVEFLLSERSSFMTGQTLVASGGRVLLP